MSEELIKGIIEKFSKACCYFDDPHEIKKLLNNELQVVISQISNDDKISYANKLNFLANALDARKAKNMVDVVKLALPYINQTANPQELDDDWVTDYFDKVSKIQTEDLKFIWCKILAEEINNPNSVSKRLLHNLFLMSRGSAEKFLNLSRFCFYDRNSSVVHPIIFIRGHQNFYSQYQITTETLKELENLFLIEMNYESGFVFKNKIYLMYTNHYIDLISNETSNNIPSGNVRFTSDGQALFKMIEKQNSNTVFDYTIQKLLNRNCTVHVYKY